MSIVQAARKFRIYPTENQKDFLARQFGATRFIYNYFLHNSKVEYETNYTSFNHNNNCKLLTSLKQEDGYSWLNEINSQSLQASLKNLDTAHTRFFKGQSKFPRFHKKSNRQCIKIPQNALVEGGLLYIPKLKSGIPIKLHRDLPKKKNSCYISITPSGKYFASFQGEIEVELLELLDNSIGIDLGIKNLLIMSDGQTVDNPNFYRRAEKHLAYKQRQHSKKKKGSKSKEKARLEIAKLNEWIANCRKDNLHKLTKRIIDENQVIIAEDLYVNNMIKNRCLAKSIQDASWGELIRQLTYKAEWYGRTFHQISPWFPSSKICYECKYVVEKLPLNIREWDCPNCQARLDRDLNAARNIRDQGLANIKAMSGSGIESDKKQKLVEALLKLDKSKKPETLAFKQG